MSKTVEFRWMDDETCEIYVGNTLIIEMTHGEHGWDGMTGIRDAVRHMAMVLGLDIHVYGVEAV